MNYKTFYSKGVPSVLKSSAPRVTSDLIWLKQMKTTDPPIPQRNGCSRHKSHKFDMSHALTLFPTDCHKLTKAIRNCDRKVPVTV